MGDCPGAWSGRFKIISGSPGANLKQNFEISPLGHLPEPKIHETEITNPQKKIQRIRYKTPDLPPQQLLC